MKNDLLFERSVKINDYQAIINTYMYNTFLMKVHQTPYLRMLTISLA